MPVWIHSRPTRGVISMTTDTTRSKISSIADDEGTVSMPNSLAEESRGTADRAEER
jgi:hypothetical protein